MDAVAYNPASSGTAGTEITFLKCGPEKHLGLAGEDSGYLYSDLYGWFDPSHFGTGSPEHIINDVSRAAARGGGFITIRQSVRGGLAGYTGRYWVSQGVTEDKVIGVALGIYLDWSRRFEEWQDRPPHGLFGPFTSFAVEDLPSQYVGFFAAVHKVDPHYVLACYLGGVQPAEDLPPRLVFPQSVPGAASLYLPPLRQLVNKSFLPFVQTQEGWRHIPWPKPLRMTALGKQSGLWRFIGDETWFFEMENALASR